MSGPFLLACRFIAFHRCRTGILAACIALNLYLPAGARLLIQRFSEQSSARAVETPLIIGAKGSQFGLVLHGLNFQGDSPDPIPVNELSQIQAGGKVEAVPLLIRFRARGYPVAGTATNYFQFRRLALREGTLFHRIGDAVLGSRAAHRLGKRPGDRLRTDPENAFDLSGPSPINLRVAGVLKETGGPDDEAVFVDLKTAWVLQGIGHGHEPAGNPSIQNENGPASDGHLHPASRQNLNTHADVTDDNLASFHFHGDPREFPITAILARAEDEKAEVLLMGRYVAADSRLQILKPSEVMEELMRVVFKARRLFDLGSLLLASMTLLLLGLIVSLSLRLRAREMETLFKLGCSRFTVFWMQTAELLIVAVLSLLAVAGLLWITRLLAPALLRFWLS